MKTLKLSSGLQELMNPLLALVPEPVSLFNAIRKTGKRGDKAHIPSDLRRVNLILDVIHDVSGKVFETQVINGDIQGAINRLANMVKDEDNHLDNLYACY